MKVPAEGRRAGQTEGLPGVVGETSLSEALAGASPETLMGNQAEVLVETPAEASQIAVVALT